MIPEAPRATLSVVVPSYTLLVPVAVIVTVAGVMLAVVVAVPADAST